MAWTRALGVVVTSAMFAVVPVVSAAQASTDPFGSPGTIPRAPSVPVPLGQTFGSNDWAENTTATVDAVNTATGSLAFAVDDVRVAGIGVPLELVRSYNGADATAGAFGRGWSSLLDAGLVLTTTTATARTESGQRLTFTKSGSSWRPAPGVRASLACALTTCTMRRFDGRTWEFRGGVPVSLRAETKGHGLTFRTGTDGRINRVWVQMRDLPPLAVDVVWTGTRVTSVKTPTRTVSYGYTSGLLTSVTDVRGGTWAYAYDAGQRLTTVADPDGDARRVVTYDGSGRVTRSQSLGGPRRHDTLFAYAPGVTMYEPLSDVNGVATRSTWTDEYAGHVVQRRTMPGGGSTAFAWDASLQLLALRDVRGTVQQFRYNAAGDLTGTKSPIDATTSAIVAMTYDAAHHMLSQTDANGQTTRFTYDGSGRLTEVVAPGGPRTKLNWDTWSLNSVTNPLGVRTDYVYDRAGNQTHAVARLGDKKPNGNGAVSAYDEAGNRVSNVDPRGNMGIALDPAYRTSYLYDAAGNLLKTTDALGRSTSAVFDGAGDVTSTKDRSGAVTPIVWNEAAGTKTTTAAGVGTVETYDAAGNVTKRTVGGHEVASYRYDANGYLVREVDAANVVTTYTRDAAGNAVVADRAGVELTTTYDGQNRPVRTESLGRVSTTAYDKAGNVVARTDPTDGLVRYSYTARGKVASVLTAAGRTSYAYDSDDNLVGRSDALGRTTLYAYDAAGRRVAATTGGATWLFGYDLAGNLTSTLDPDGRAATFTVDRANRRTAERYRWPLKPGTGSDVTFALDDLDRRTSMTDDEGTTTYEYDASGLLTEVTRGADTFGYDYSTPGTTKQTYPDGTVVEYQVDDASHLMDVSSTSPGSPGVDVRVAYVRDDFRRATHLTALNGIVEDRTWNARDDLTEQKLSLTGDQVAKATYSYDLAGNRLSAETTRGATTTELSYGYGDAASGSSPAPGGGGADPAVAPVDARLTSFTLDGDATSYGYDAMGNRTSTTTPGGTTAHAYDSRDRRAGWTHDAAGNVTKMGTRTLAYDAAGRITDVTDGATTTTFTYDGDGNRLTKTVDAVTTEYLWDVRGAFPLLALEREEDGTLIRRYVNGDGPVAMQTPNDTYYLHLDPLGSVTGVTDANGALVASYTYDPWGNVVDSDETAAAPALPLGFTAQYRDEETGLYYLRARTYDPESGRFLQRDPLGPLAGAPAESPYAYASNRPTVLTDPTGMTPTPETVFLGQPSLLGDVANSTKLSLSAVSVGVSAGTQWATTAAKQAAAAGNAAGQASKTLKHLTTAGKVLTVAGVLLQVVLTEEACRVGTTQQCVSASVSMAFTVGCLAISSGAGSVACTVIGAALSYVIAEYGDEIWEWTTDAAVAGWAAASEGARQLAGIVEEGLDIAVAATLDGINVALDDITSAYGTVSDALVSGFNDLGDDIVSGFENAVDVLVDAGYSAVELGEMLAESFELGVLDAVAIMEDFGYDVGDIALALLETFDQTAAEAAAILQDFGHSVAEIATQLADVFESTAAEAAEVLKDLGYAISDIATQLADAFESTAAEAAEIFQDLGYAIADIATELADVFESTAAEAAAIFTDLGYDIADIATQLADVFESTAAEAAEIFQDLGYTIADIATQLEGVFASTAAEAAAIFTDLGYDIADIATQLKDVFDSTAAEAAAVLKDLGYGVAAIATQLADVFASTAAEAAEVLKDLGYAIADIATQLADVFGSTAAEAAAVLKDLGYAIADIATQLADVFGSSAADAAAIFTDLGYAIADIATQLADVFESTAEDAAAILRELGYAFADIATQLRDVFALLPGAAAGVLNLIGAGATAIADAMGDLYAKTAAEAAAILQTLSYGANAIADALQDAYAQSAAQVAVILKGLGVAADLVAGALGAAFGIGAAAVAEALKEAAYALNTITDVLQDIYGLGATTVAGILQDLGYAGDQVASALKSVGYAIADIAAGLSSAFGSAGSTIGGWLQSAGFSLDSIEAVGGAIGSWASDALDAIEACLSDPLDCIGL